MELNNTVDRLTVQTSHDQCNQMLSELQNLLHAALKSSLKSAVYHSENLSLS